MIWLLLALAALFFASMLAVGLAVVATVLLVWLAVAVCRTLIVGLASLRVERPEGSGE
jgi:hypothetical protein